MKEVIRYQILDARCELTRGSSRASGWDARARLDVPFTLQPSKRAVVPLGIILDLEPGWECQVRPRSGMALKYGITVLNSPGTIDSDFRGECGAIIINHSTEPYTITPGERICQLVFAEVPEIELQTIEAATLTDRGAGGYGSTGKL